MRPALLFAVMLGCSAPIPPAPDAGGHRASEALEACAALRGPVESIAQTVERLNTLPRPVNVPCFVASIARPLDLVVTTSTVSAQPSESSKSPRIFIMKQGIAIGVVPSGVGAHLLELGEWQTTKLTLKGEIEFPLAAPLAADAPLTRILMNNGMTTCALCHRYENPHPSIAHGYVSAAYRPNPGTLLTLDALTAEHQACVDASDTSERCEMFHALFDFGQVRAGAFSKDVELFF